MFVRLPGYLQQPNSDWNLLRDNLAGFLYLDINPYNETVTFGFRPRAAAHSQMQGDYTPFIGNDLVQHCRFVCRRLISLAAKQLFELQVLVGVVHVDFPLVHELKTQLEWDGRQFASRLGNPQNFCYASQSFTGG